VRILLIQSGGFVGRPLRYEVDISKLSPADLAALRRAMAEVPAAAPPAMTSAGETRIRLEGDDGTVAERSISHAKPDPRLTQLAEKLQAHSKPVKDR
jgi:hypothetical protein